MENFHHVTVLLQETVDSIKPQPGGIYVDCTLGGAGHSSEIVKKIIPGGLLIGIDQDPVALKAAREKLAEHRENVKLVHANFVDIKKVLADLAIEAVDGIIFDLGVSSPQLDVGERGFSYKQDAPLDMRMNSGDQVTAANLVNNLTAEQLTKIIWDYGEERWAKRIAQFIVEKRTIIPLETTGQLVDIIKKAVPVGARKEGPHPAKRTFQALRIAVNDELNRFALALKEAVDCLRSGGRVAVISFHSLEDRLAKDIFKELAVKCVCPPLFPICVCGTEAKLRIITNKPLLPGELELSQNPRARSAKLRVAEKL